MDFFSLFLLFVSSPRPWGCFLLSNCHVSPGKVFPTPVGVFPCHVHGSFIAVRLPHARGGVSAFAVQAVKREGSSPRPWGCFFLEKYLKSIQDVFPTPVGVFLRGGFGRFGFYCLPHARGGVS